MHLSLVTNVSPELSSAEPVTLGEQKLHMRLDEDLDDAYVLDCIKAARLWVEGQTRRPLVLAAYDGTIDYNWPMRHCQYFIALPINPVTAVDYVQYVDTSGSTQTLSTSLYTAVTRNNGSYIVPAYNATWPSVRDVPNAVTVRFRVGYSTVPLDLKQAVMILAATFYEERDTAAGAPKAVESLISPHRSVSFP